MDADDGLEEQLASNVKRIMHLFADVHGGAVPSPRLVVYSAPQQPSTFVGTGVLINCVDLRINDNQERQARVLAVLAHELAHAFWMHRVQWATPRIAAVMNELVAECLEHLALTRLGGAVAAERVDRWTLWSRIRAALHPLDQNPERWSGYIGALVLRPYLNIWPECIERGLRDMWEGGQKKDLGVTEIAKIFGRACNEDLRTVIADVSNGGSVVIGSVRAHYDKKKEQWCLVIRTLARDRQRLLDRLRARGLTAEMMKNRSIAVRCKSSKDVGQTYDEISPWFVLSRREARVLLLPLFTRLAPILRIANSAKARLEENRTQSRIQLLLGGLLWLALNSESPDGYRLLAGAIGGVMPSLRRAVARAGGRRAFHDGEARLRAVLMDT